MNSKLLLDENHIYNFFLLHLPVLIQTQFSALYDLRNEQEISFRTFSNGGDGKSLREFFFNIYAVICW